MACIFFCHVTGMFCSKTVQSPRAVIMPASHAIQTQLHVSASPTSNEASEFYSLLFHDDRKSNAILATRKSGLWAEESLPCSQLAYLRTTFLDSNDHYVTVNSFAGKRRDTNRCRQINAIMLDIDAHEGNHTTVVPALKHEVNRAISAGAIPTPNIVVDTGRGLQVYYVFEKSIPYRLKSGSVNESVLEFLGDVRQIVSNLMESQVASRVPGAQVDKSVSDLARVSRIPGSYNPAAGRKAQLIATSRAYWDLASLKSACGLATQSKQSKPAAKYAAIYRFDRLQMSRMTKIEELVTYREQRGGCIGTRDLILFVYYNSATQVVGPQEALKRTKALNKRFAKTLPEEDIEQIAATVDSNVVMCGSERGKKGFYPLSRENVIAKLCLTAEEIEALNFFASKRASDRAAAKLNTAAKRTKRDKTICKLYGNGLTQAQVAAFIGCSIGTVSAVVRRENIDCGSIKKDQRKKFIEALTAKTKKNPLSNQPLSFFRHTSWVCGAAFVLQTSEVGSELAPLYEDGVRLVE